ncbi:MAG: O-antigen ligase family protein [Clostridia bacterium]|nr:O-antigen ligase family protein [Clostridia bacterium]
MTQIVSANSSQNSENKFNFNNIKQVISKAINSIWCLAVISLLIVGCWAIDFPFVSIGLLAMYEVAVFVFCPENPKAFILPVISVSYMITSIYGVFHWVYYGICIGIFIATIITYILLQKYKFGKTFKKGKFFWVFAYSSLGNCLGGLVGFWDWTAFLVTFVLSILVYGIYWFCLNFLKDYKKYFAYCLIFLTLIITAELLINYLRADDILHALQHKDVTVGTGEINGAAIFMLSGVCACFYLATKHKYDYLYILLALFFDVAIFLTHSRMALLIAAVISVVYFFFVLKKSQNKKIILIGLSCLIAVILLFCAVFFNKIKDVLSYYLSLGFKANGRDKLLPWMWTKFKENPFFGIGFITREPDVLSGLYPGMKDIGGFSLVNAHNFFLHYLTCTGVIGFALNIPFYIVKYKETFKHFNKFKLFALMNFICIFISSLFDPAPNNSIFNIIIVLILLALIENDNDQIECITNKSEKLKVNTNSEELKSCVCCCEEKLIVQTEESKEEIVNIKEKTNEKTKSVLSLNKDSAKTNLKQNKKTTKGKMAQKSTKNTLK